MSANDYLKSILEEIEELEHSIKDYETMWDSDADWLKKSLEDKKTKLNNLKQQLFSCCAWLSTDILPFLKQTLEAFENIPYEIVESDAEITIRAINNKDKKEIVFKKGYRAIESEDRVELLPLQNFGDKTTDIYLDTRELGFLEEANPLMESYPYLKVILKDLASYIAKIYKRSIDITPQEMLTFIKEVIKIKFKNQIKDGYDINTNLDQIVIELLEFIYFKEISFYNPTPEQKEALYEAIKKGEYNALGTSPYWFGKKISLYILIRWESMRSDQRKANKLLGQITEENYVVIGALTDLIECIEYLDKYEQHYISINGHTQTKATEEEKKELEKIIEKILGNNYTWREAREIVSNVNRLNPHINYMFPHNVDEVSLVFSPTVETYFDKLPNVTLKTDVSFIQDKANLWIKQLNEENIEQLFATLSNDGIEEYLRRMIISNWDIPTIVFENAPSNFKNSLEYIREELARSTTLSEPSLEILFRDRKTNAKLVALAKGVLYSLLPKGPVQDILSQCIKNQDVMQCNRGTVGYNDFNSLTLPDRSVITSLYCEDIRPYYDRLQKSYAYYYALESDLEYIEGCIEIFGQVLISQIFRNGNKRTAKCLFNELLISRGIIPPITDLNENERALWDKLAYSRFRRFNKIKPILLQDAITIQQQIQSTGIGLATDVSLDALERREFSKRAYYF